MFFILHAAYPLGFITEQKLHFMRITACMQFAMTSFTLFTYLGKISPLTSDKLAKLMF